MITVELQQIPEGEQEYRTAAILSVVEDGTYQLDDDPEELFPTGLHVVVPDDHPGLRQVRFEEDPRIWACHLLGSLLRSGYVVPVATYDDTAAEDA